MCQCLLDTDQTLNYCDNMVEINIRIDFKNILFLELFRAY